MSLIKSLQEIINDDSATRTLAESESRILKYMDESFSGYKLKAEDVLNVVEKVENYTGLVVLNDIQFYTYCGHHFAPFWGEATVVYEPGNIITGLGKIVRLVKDVHAKRLQIQELMSRDIALDIERVLGAKGVFVMTKAKHLCTCSRGPKDDVSTTSVYYGVGSLSNKKPSDFIY